MTIELRCLSCMEPKTAEGPCMACGIDDRELSVSANMLQPGTVLAGHFLIGRLLGAGGFGNTYLGFDLNLHMKLAIKEFLPKDLAGRDRYTSALMVYSGSDQSSDFAVGLEKFLEEARVLARFRNHPNIVSISHFFKEHNTAYIVMDYLEGITFKEYLRQKGGKLSYEETIRIMTPVIDALREVHQVGMLHRDISPDNIYITRTGQVKVLDFGAARQAIGEVSKSLSVILKPGYAPSEQYFSKGKQGPWTDVYATAATIYHAVTGSLPPESLERMEEDELRPPTELGVAIRPDAEAALLKALAVRGANRFQTMADFQEALFGQSGINADTIRSVTSPVQVAPPVPAVQVSQAPVPTPIQAQATVPVQAPATVKPSPVVKMTELSIGDYLRFGRYQNQAILWRIVHFTASGAPILLSDRILCLKSFDAAGKLHADQERRDAGSNRWQYANLREWLNGQNRIKWSQNEPSKSNIWGRHNPYHSETGFLDRTHFNETELNLITAYEREAMLANLDMTDQVKSETVADKVFVLSLEELQQWVISQADLLGADYVVAKPTKAAVALSGYKHSKLSEAEHWHYWLSSPFASTSYYTQGVDREGNIDGNRCYDDTIGVRPALHVSAHLNRVIVAGNGNADDPYSL